MGQQHIAQPERDGEQHRAHPGHLPQQARETAPQTSPRADRGQQRIARARGARDDRCERHERDQPGGVVYDFHARAFVGLIHGS